jgi:hypothetical protein
LILSIAQSFPSVIFLIKNVLSPDHKHNGLKR